MKKQDVHAHFTSSFPISFLEIDGHQVSYKESYESLDKTLSLQDRKLFQELLDEARISPKNAFQKALGRHKQGNSFKELDNLTAYLYLQNGEPEEAEKLIYSSFQDYPDYLFAKINYADLCLKKNKPEKIPLIFPSFRLKDLFPERSSFHVSEFRGFSLLACRYHLKIKDYLSAEKHYENARLADPLDPGVLVLEKKFLPKSKIKRLLLKLIKAYSR